MTHKRFRFTIGHLLVLTVAVGWIDAVARSLQLVSKVQLEATELQALSDEELLSRLNISQVNER